MRIITQSGANLSDWPLPNVLGAISPKSKMIIVVTPTLMARASFEKYLSVIFEERVAIKILTKLFPTRIVVRISLGISSHFFMAHESTPCSSAICFAFSWGKERSAASEPEKKADNRRDTTRIRISWSVLIFYVLDKISVNNRAGRDGGSIKSISC
jgi:hypothetical protein